MRFEQLIADIDKIRCFRQTGTYDSGHMTFDLVNIDGLYVQCFVNVIRVNNNAIIFEWHNERFGLYTNLEEVINNSSPFIQEALLFNLDIFRIKFVDFE